ncbi:hypothetical protein TrRE_jg12313 [Triparma retinervis]|uniref:diacylglycerol O-acyltransferase n=1 Tax=Triparma retinervis TaxID=2557542 RepID=A0A9W6ZQ27_9STRA|nr:hypothetical protein TrRE_jg12313 [Triparma retinervis]
MVGYGLQLSLVACWVGGFASPAFCYHWYKTKNSVALSLYAAIIASGYIFPSSYSGSPSLKDFYMRYIFLPFKSSQRRFRHIPTKDDPGIVLYHPHGMFSWGFANGGAWNFFYYQRGFQGLVASSLLHAPGFRLLFVKLLGGINSAEKPELVRKMKNKESFGLIPGGFHEATIAYPGTSRVFLKNRKGFVKYALQHGFTLTPVYTFGESATYWNASGFWKLPEDVDKWHKAYMEHLKKHFDTYKKEFGGTEADSELEIW